jgi:hypothetical protein
MHQGKNQRIERGGSAEHMLAGIVDKTRAAGNIARIAKGDIGIIKPPIVKEPEQKQRTHGSPCKRQKCPDPPTRHTQKPLRFH